MTIKRLNIGQLLWQRELENGELTGNIFEIADILASGNIAIKPKEAKWGIQQFKVFNINGKLIRNDKEYTLSPYNNDDKYATEKDTQFS